MSQSRIHFPNLNGLRFVAAFLVFLSHVEDQKEIFGLPSIYQVPYIHSLGPLGVTIFFVLSGFLITFLLMKEKSEYSKIEIGKFYVRRALRIWPLYFVIIVLGLFILPSIPFLHVPGRTEAIPGNLATKAALFFLFLPNLAVQIYGLMAYVLQTWSIGVEEQFYLVWPWVIQNSRKLLRVLFVIVAVAVFMKTSFFYDLLWRINKHSVRLDFRDFNKVTTAFWYFIYYFRIGCMAIGGIAAYLVFSEERRVLNFLLDWRISLFSLFVLLVIPFHEFHLFHEFASVFIAILILKLTDATSSSFILNKQPFDFLGKISYGFYMFHILCIVLVLKLILVFGFKQEGWLNVFLYPLSLALACLVATTSYYLFELPFLKIKRQSFTKVDNV